MKYLPHVSGSLGALALIAAIYFAYQSNKKDQIIADLNAKIAKPVAEATPAAGK